MESSTDSDCEQVNVINKFSDAEKNTEEASCNVERTLSNASISNHHSCKNQHGVQSSSRVIQRKENIIESAFNKKIRCNKSTANQKKIKTGAQRSKEYRERQKMKQRQITPTPTERMRDRREKLKLSPTQYNAMKVQAAKYSKTYRNKKKTFKESTLCGIAQSESENQAKTGAERSRKYRERLRIEKQGTQVQSSIEESQGAVQIKIEPDVHQ